MKNIAKNGFFQKLKKRFLSAFVLLSMILSLGQPLLYATVINGVGNTLSGANSNFINLSNSGAYPVNFSFSGTLDTGNTFLLTALDGSGHTLTGSLVSTSGGQSSGSIVFNFSNSSLQQGAIIYNGTVYSGGITSPVVASGMTLTGILDTTSPVVSLVGSGIVTVPVGGLYSESGATWIDNRDGSGTLSTPSSGSVNNSISGSYILEYRKTDTAGNTSPTVSRTVMIGSTGTTNTGTQVPIVVNITSHANNAIVSDFPVVFSGTVAGIGGVSSITVNGAPATFGLGTWSTTLTNLTGGFNTIRVLGTDLSGNTSSGVVVLNAVSKPLNINIALSGTTSAVVNFATYFTATGTILYGTGVNSLNTSNTGSTSGSGTIHSFTLMGLLPDTIYYFLAQVQDGINAPIMRFKTPVVIDTSTASGSIVATGSVYLSGATATGITFSQSGSLTLMSLGSTGTSLSIPLNGLSIVASGSSWDRLIQAPEPTSTPTNLSFSGFSMVGPMYQIGNPNTKLVFSGQVVTVSVRLGSMLSGQTIHIMRSSDTGLNYTDIGTCVVSNGGDCIFTTNQLSLFVFLTPATAIGLSFSGVTGAELSTVYLSNPITLTGITSQTPISIVGGEYRINSGAFTTMTGTINSGDIVVLRSVSSASNSTTTNTILTVGGVSATFSITTKAASGGGGGGGGSGGPGGPSGGGLVIDSCPGGDFSPSYYDSTCVASSTGNVLSPFTGGFNIPAIIITIPSDIKFRDVVGNWAETYINKLVTRGIVDNTTLYHPDSNLTRAEFLKIVINTTGWEVPMTGLDIPFGDVPMDRWYARYVSLALSKGMIQNGTQFHPNNSITRAEATKILITALGASLNESTIIAFSDVPSNFSLGKYIQTATSLSILSGQIVYGQRVFRPNDNITRAEIAKVVANAFHL